MEYDEDNEPMIYTSAQIKKLRDGLIERFESEDLSYDEQYLEMLALVDKIIARRSPCHYCN